MVINAVSVPNTLGTNSGNLTAFVVGVVGGPAGGVQTGVGSTQMIRNITSGDGAGGIRLPRFEGTTVLTPAMGGAPPTLTTTLNGVLNVAPNNAIVKTTGAVATTPSPEEVWLRRSGLRNLENRGKGRSTFPRPRCRPQDHGGRPPSGAGPILRPGAGIWGFSEAWWSPLAGDYFFAVC